jgi:hypothetical protein
MPENNTQKRARFNYFFGMLSVYAEIRGIRFIHGRDSYVRTAERQNELYKQGKSKADGYKVKSNHQFDRARDLYIIDEAGKITEQKEAYEILGKFWEGMNPGELRWGGSFKSFPELCHFELP